MICIIESKLNSIYLHQVICDKDAIRTIDRCAYLGILIRCTAIDTRMQRNGYYLGTPLPTGEFQMTDISISLQDKENIIIGTVVSLIYHRYVLDNRIITTLMIGSMKGNSTIRVFYHMLLILIPPLVETINICKIIEDRFSIDR